TALGTPAAGIKIELYRIESDDQRTHLKTLNTNQDGRTDEKILPETEFALGTYELVFHTAEYFDNSASSKEAPRFLSEVPIRFGMSEASHYHVPLLLSPFGYSTYRGS
ncbi:MAG: hydroxyisourate hydrolase, partial [Paracoccaceae bacterium]